MQWITSNAPTGWLLCAGQGANTNAYGKLFADIGYQYGGSGTNFMLPDMRGRGPVGMGAGPGWTERNLGNTGGAETVTLSISQMPAHNHYYGLQVNETGQGDTWPHGANNGGNHFHKWTDNEGGGQAHENMPPFLVLNFIIKH